MRTIILLLGSLLFIGSAHAQSFDSYTYTPITGVLSGPGPIGVPRQTDVVLVNRLSGTSGLSLSSFASATDAQNLNERINQAFQQLNNNATLLERGVAAAVALPGAFMPSAPGKTAWAINGAAFQSQFGAGISLAHRLNLSTPIAVTAAYGNGGGTAHVGRFGLMGEF